MRPKRLERPQFSSQFLGDGAAIVRSSNDLRLQENDEFGAVLTIVMISEKTSEHGNSGKDRNAIFPDRLRIPKEAAERDDLSVQNGDGG